MKFLYLSPRPLWPADRGGNQRSNLLYRALRAIGEVDFYLLQRVPLDAQQEKIHKESYNLVGQSATPRRGQRGLWKYLYPVAPGPVNRIAHNFGGHSAHYIPANNILTELTELHRKNRYDAVVGRYLMPTAAAGGIALPVPTIVDIDDVDTQKYVSRIDRPGAGQFEKAMVRWHISRFERVVPVVAQSANHLWVAASEDINAVPHPSISVLNNIPYVEEGTSVKSDSDDSNSNMIVAIASMNFPVNERAVDRFVFDVWPHIHRQAPEAKFVVAGSQMTSRQCARWSSVNGVEALGFVEDLAELYRKAAFTVVPVFEGGGTKIKVLESLLYSRTSVVAEHSIRGYDHVLHDEDSLMIAKSEQDFVNKCLVLLKNPELRQTLADRGRELIEKHFSFASFADRVNTDVCETIRKKSATS